MQMQGIHADLREKVDEVYQIFVKISSLNANRAKLCIALFSHVNHILLDPLWIDLTAFSGTDKGEADLS